MKECVAMTATPFVVERSMTACRPPRVFCLSLTLKQLWPWARTTDKWTPGLGQGAAQIFSSNSQTKQKQHDKNNRGREAVLLRQVKLNRLHGQNKKENKDKCKTVHPLSHALKTAASSTSSRQKKRKIMHECRFNPFVAVKSRRDILQVSCNMSYSFTALLAH